MWPPHQFTGADHDLGVPVILTLPDRASMTRELGEHIESLQHALCHLHSMAEGYIAAVFLDKRSSEEMDLYNEWSKTPEARAVGVPLFDLSIKYRRIANDAAAVSAHDVTVALTRLKPLVDAENAFNDGIDRERYALAAESVNALFADSREPRNRASHKENSLESVRHGAKEDGRVDDVVHYSKGSYVGNVMTDARKYVVKTKKYGKDGGGELASVPINLDAAARLCAFVRELYDAFPRERFHEEGPRFA